MVQPRSVDSLTRCFLRKRIVHPREHLRQRLVDQHRDDDVDRALDEGERHVEDHQRLDKGIRRGQDRLVRVHNILHPAEHLRVDRINDEIIGDYADPGHRQRAGDTGDQRAGFRFFVFVDQPCGECEHRAEDEVRQLADAEGHGDRAVKKVLHKADQHARRGAENERADELGDIGKIQLEERGHERNGIIGIKQIPAKKRRREPFGTRLRFFANVCHINNF